MNELTPDAKLGIEFRGELQKELGLVGRNITLVPHSYVQTTYIRELFRTVTRKIRGVTEEYPEGIFDRKAAKGGGK